MQHTRVSADDVRQEVELADELIRECIRETPLEKSPRLSRESGGTVLLKLENMQVTGSFKARGAFSKLLSLDKAQRSAGVVTASTGNHAMAMLHAMKLIEVPGEVWISDKASPSKIEALRSRGANLRIIDIDPGAVEVLAREEAGHTGRTYISPYNDLQVIGGQGTVAAELVRQELGLNAVFVPVGGGGLISGIAGYLSKVAHKTLVIGCQPANAPLMTHSVKYGKLIEIPFSPTLSDATAGFIEPGSVTFPICTEHVQDWITVTEEEIAAAVRLIIEEHSMLIEGAAALTVAAFLKTRERWRGKSVALVLSGSHISVRDLAQVMAAHA